MLTFIKKHLVTIILCLVFATGLGVLLYPTVSSWWNAQRQSRTVAAYNDTVSEMSDADYAKALESAQEYNRELYLTGSDTTLAEPDAVEGYMELLDVSGTGVMGYITIDRIDVELPIYHTTSDSALSAGAGHMQGTSLPVGGENTHCVITGHRGLPTARMFTDLDLIETGDIFDLHVLGDTLRYQVDQIIVVLPDETEELYIQQGHDYCTLVTCTPYGVNTHRLLIRGTRIPYEEDSVVQIIEEENEETRISPFWFIVAGMIVFVLLVSEIIVRIITAGRRRKEKTEKTDHT